MDFAKSFSFILEDPDWLSKVLIGSGILLVSSLLSPLLIGLLGFAIVTGYQLDLLDNVRRGREHPLPEWRDKWGEWLVLGLKLWAALIVWALPAIVLGILGGIGAAMTGGNDTAAVIGGLLLACFGCLLFLWVIAIVLVSPAIYIKLAESDKLSSAFQFREIFAFTRDNIGPVIIAVIVYWVASMVISLIGSIVGAIVCLVGLIVTLPAAQFITMLIQSHLYAQVDQSGGLLGQE